MSETVFKGFGDKALPFLKALDFHQNREWFVENKDLFEAHLHEPLGDLIDDLIARFEKAGLPFKGDRKKSQFRMNRAASTSASALRTTRAAMPPSRGGSRSRSFSQPCARPSSTSRRTTAPWWPH